MHWAKWTHLMHHWCTIDHNFLCGCINILYYHAPRQELIWNKKMSGKSRNHKDSRQFQSLLNTSRAGLKKVLSWIGTGYDTIVWYHPRNCKNFNPISSCDMRMINTLDWQYHPFMNSLVSQLYCYQHKEPAFEALDFSASSKCESRRKERLVLVIRLGFVTVKIYSY